jgi:hypothetical protein
MRIAVTLVALVLSGQSLCADDYGDPYYEYRDEVGRGEFSYDDSEDIPWIENETEVLAVPSPENLTDLRLDQRPPGMNFLIDKSRITVNPDDRVVRVWLWARSDSGSESGTFEGYRCETREYKVYAYANPKRTPPVKKAKKPRWKTIHGKRSGNYRLELLQDYFCGIRGTRSAGEIADIMTGEFQPEYFMSQ